jgi:WD repeat-containing protein 59
MSFRNPPGGNNQLPALSAPIGHRSILAEVRAAPVTGRPFIPYANVSPDDEPEVETAKTFSQGQLQSKKLHIDPSLLANARSQGGKMSRGTKSGPGPKTGGRVQMDALTWLSNVKMVDEKKSGEDVGSSHSPKRKEKGSASAPTSSGPSRANSKSRLGEDDGNIQVEEAESEVTSPTIQRSLSESDATAEYEKEKERKDPVGDSGQSLQDEYVPHLLSLPCYC